MIDRAIFSLPGIRKMLALTLALAVARALCVVGQALGLAHAVVGVWGGQPLIDQALWLVLFLVGFVARQGIASIQAAALDRYARERASELRQQLLRRVLSEGPALVQARGSASVAQTLIDGIEDVRAYIALIVPKIVSVIAVPLVLLAAIFPLDWVSGVIALVCFPFIILYMVMIGHTAKDDAARRHGEFQRMANHFMDSLAGIDDLKAFGQSRAYEDRIFAASERFREMTMKTLRVATLSSTVLDMFATLALAGVAVMLGFRLVDGSMSFLPALAVLIMVPEYFRPIREFAADYHASLDGRSAFAAIRGILGACPVKSDRTPKLGLRENRVQDAHGSVDVPAHPPVLELDGVGFSYADREDALSGVSFRAEGPCKVGIVGPSGAGKSTLMALLAGFADPSVGGVTVDGERLATLRGSAWQRLASFIPQDPYIFHASLRENLAFYNPNASDEQIWRAVRLAGLEELVTQLPEGLDTLIGQGARTLSGGQAHRVALARAFLDGSRSVLLLDEPTAHLDIETELELKERLLPLMEGRLVFFATHRLHWMAQMDYVIEIEAGCVAWQGSAEAWRARRAAALGVEGGETPQAVVCWQDESPVVASGGVEPDDASWSACEGGDDAASSSPSACSDVQDAPWGGSLRILARVANAWRADTWVRPFFARYWRVLALALTLGLVAAAFAGALMFTSGYMISLAATLPFTVLAVHVPSLYVRIFGVGKPALGYLERLVSHDWALRMTSELRRRLYRSVEGQSAALRGSRRLGDLLGLLAEDIEHVQNLYLRTVFPLAIAWLLYVVVIIALGAFSAGAALALALLLGVVVFLLPAVSVCVNGAKLERAKSVKARLYADLTDNVLGVADWMYAGRADDYLDRYRSVQREADRIDAEIARFGHVRDVVAQVFFAFSALVLLAWASAVFAPAAPVTTGAAGALAAFTPENAVAHAGNWVAAFALCLFPLIDSFAPASEAAMGLVTYGDSIERMNSLSGDAAPRAPKDSGRFAAPVPASSFARASDVSFDGVRFAYQEGGHPVLCNLDLRIPAGQRIAILGRSGAGKSTMAALLHGEIAPQAGFVRVGGVDAASLGEKVAHSVGIIRQSPHLFNWTLRENLALAKPSATDEELACVLEKVGLSELLERLPAGLDTVVDERGRRFSGGERHRIALARVLLADSPVVVLDEPFAGLDPLTEKALIDVMFDTLAGRTVVMVTHHLQGVSACDRVVFVEGGRIVLDGTPGQLACESARYRALLSAERG